MSFLRASTCALEEPNSTPSGTMTAPRPPLSSRRRNRWRNRISVFLHLGRKRRVHVARVDRAFERRIGEDDVVRLSSLKAFESVSV